MPVVKTLTVRLPEAIAADIEAESKRRNISKSDVVRECLEARAYRSMGQGAPYEAIADLVGSVKGLPADLSKRADYYLERKGYGTKRPR
jgi:Arc/MetJ-type ribon-helix-helix transcriptional regulator